MIINLINSIRKFVCYLFWPQRFDKTRYDNEY